jgi:hypothetical protein
MGPLVKGSSTEFVEGFHNIGYSAMDFISAGENDIGYII